MEPTNSPASHPTLQPASDGNISHITDPERNLTSPQLSPTSMPQNNALLPISKIHEDLLLLIFKLAGGDSTGDHLDRKQVVNITHVCSSWRALALNYPNLWTCIRLHFLRELRWANEMANRAKRAPLCLELGIGLHGPRYICGNSKPRVEQLYTDVLPLLDRRLLDVSRIDELFIEANNSNATTAETIVELLASFHGNNSSVRTLAISRRIDHCPKRGAPIIRPISIPLRLLSSSTPCLQRLRLASSHCRIPLHSLSPCSFTELISLSLHGASCPDSLGQLLGILSATYRLRNLWLDLKAGGQFTAEPHDTPTAPIVLHQLMFIDISANVQDCADVFTRISYPASAETDFLLLRNQTFSLSPFHSFMNHPSFLEKLATRNPSNVILCLDEIEDEPFIRIWDGPFELANHLQHWGDWKGHTGVSIVIDEGAPAMSLPLILESFNVPNLQMMMVHRLHDWTEEWRRFFLRHPEVSDMRIITHNISGFTSILSLPANGSNTWMCLPKLSTISINIHDAKDREETNVMNYDGQDGLDSYDQYEAILRCLTDSSPRSRNTDSYAVVVN